ncbi:hypothetical protein LCGC14_0899990, partial [marine sediment metagenome]
FYNLRILPFLIVYEIKYIMLKSRNAKKIWPNGTELLLEEGIIIANYFLKFCQKKIIIMSSAQIATLLKTL